LLDLSLLHMCRQAFAIVKLIKIAQLELRHVMLALEASLSLVILL